VFEGLDVSIDQGFSEQEINRALIDEGFESNTVDLLIKNKANKNLFAVQPIVESVQLGQVEQIQSEQIEQSDTTQTEQVEQVEQVQESDILGQLAATIVGGPSSKTVRDFPGEEVIAEDQIDEAVQQQTRKNISLTAQALGAPTVEEITNLKPYEHKTLSLELNLGMYQNIYNKYFDKTSFLDPNTSDEDRKKEVDSINYTKAKKLNEAGFDVTYRDDTQQFYKNNRETGKAQVIESGIMQSMINSYFEIAGAGIGTYAGAVIGGFTPVPGGAFIGGILGSGIGAALGRGGDILRNSHVIGEYLEGRQVVDRMIDAGGNDVMWTTLGVGALKLTASSWKKLGQIYNKLVTEPPSVERVKGLLRSNFFVTDKEVDSILSDWVSVNAPQVTEETSENLVRAYTNIFPEFKDVLEKAAIENTQVAASLARSVQDRKKLLNITIKKNIPTEFTVDSAGNRVEKSFGDILVDDIESYQNSTKRFYAGVKQEGIDAIDKKGVDIISKEIVGKEISEDFKRLIAKKIKPFKTGELYSENISKVQDFVNTASKEIDQVKHKKHFDSFVAKLETNFKGESLQKLVNIRQATKGFKKFLKGEKGGGIVLDSLDDISVYVDSEIDSTVRKLLEIEGKLVGGVSKDIIYSPRMKALQPIFDSLETRPDINRQRYSFINLLTNVDKTLKAETFESLYTTKKVVNDFIFNTNGLSVDTKKDLFKASGIIKEEIKSVAKKHMDNPQDWIKQFDKADKTYSEMLTFNSNIMLKELMKPGLKPDSFKSIMVKYIDTTKDPMGQVFKRLPKKDYVQAENVVVDHFFEKASKKATNRVEFTDIESLAENLSKINFKTEQARSLSKAISTLSKSFKSEVTSANITNRGAQSQSEGIGTTLKGRLLQIFNTVMVKIFRTQFPTRRGRLAALAKITGDVIENPLNLKNVTKLLKEVPTSNRIEVEDAIKNVQVEWLKDKSFLPGRIKPNQYKQDF